jgi:hypothetical protein
MELIRLGIIARAVETRPFEPDFYSKLLHGYDELWINCDFMSGLLMSSLITGKVSSEIDIDHKDCYTIDNEGLTASLFSQLPPMKAEQSEMQLSLTTQ